MEKVRLSTEKIPREKKLCPLCGVPLDEANICRSFSCDNLGKAVTNPVIKKLAPEQSPELLAKQEEKISKEKYEELESSIKKQINAVLKFLNLTINSPEASIKQAIEKNNLEKNDNLKNFLKEQLGKISSANEGGDVETDRKIFGALPAAIRKLLNIVDHRFVVSVSMEKISLPLLAKETYSKIREEILNQYKENEEPNLVKIKEAIKNIINNKTENLRLELITEFLEKSLSLELHESRKEDQKRQIENIAESGPRKLEEIYKSLKESGKYTDKMINDTIQKYLFDGNIMKNQINYMLRIAPTMEDIFKEILEEKRKEFERHGI